MPADKVTMALLKDFIDEHMVALNAEIKALRSEVASLKTEVMVLRNQSNRSLPGQAPTTVPGGKSGDGQAASFAAVVRKSVQTAINDEKCKTEVIISGAEEKGQDSKMVTDLCETLNFQTKPLDVNRVGQKKIDSDHQRLLKVTFASPFEARTFRAKYDEKKKIDAGTVPKLRMRAGRNEDEQALFKKLNMEAYKLNAAAKSADQNASFSVREHGVIWKFMKNDRGKWVHDQDWSNAKPQGNES